jgi:hypothetical protein
VVAEAETVAAEEETVAAEEETVAAEAAAAGPRVEAAAGPRVEEAAAGEAEEEEEAAAAAWSGPLRSASARRAAAVRPKTDLASGWTRRSLRRGRGQRLRRPARAGQVRRLVELAHGVRDDAA